MLYSAALEGMDDAIGKSAVLNAVMNGDWPPTPAAILKEYQQLSPGQFPTPDEVVEWVHSTARELGSWACPDPERPGCHLLGDPVYPSPVHRMAVDVYGGWQAVCANENRDALNRQLREASEGAREHFRRCPEEYEREVALEAPKQETRAIHQREPRKAIPPPVKGGLGEKIVEAVRSGRWTMPEALGALMKGVDDDGV